MQHAVCPESDPVAAFVRLEVDVRRTHFDGVEEHLVDEADNRCVVSATAGIVVRLCIIVACLEIQIHEIVVVQIAQPVLFGSVEVLLYDRTELVVFDQNAFGGDAGVD